MKYDNSFSLLMFMIMFKKSISHIKIYVKNNLFYKPHFNFKKKKHTRKNVDEILVQRERGKKKAVEHRPQRGRRKKKKRKNEILGSQINERKKL